MIKQRIINQRAFGVTFSDAGKASIRLWHLQARQVAVLVEGNASAIELTKESDGFWSTETTAIRPGDLYSVLVDNERVYPDSASLVQPNGVYGASQAVDVQAYKWDDHAWINSPFDGYQMAELAIENFTPEGTFCAADRQVGELKRNGISAVVINPTRPIATPAPMGLDAASLYTIQTSYGSPAQLQHFIDTCHYEGIAVCVDLDYGQLQPAETVQQPTASYPIRRLRTAFANSSQRAEVARAKASIQYCVDNALMWFRDFHVDALRMNGVHFLPDAEALLRKIRQAANELTHQTGHQYYMLVDCMADGQGISGKSYQQFPCGQKSELAASKNGQPQLAVIRKYRLDYLYERHFASVLRDLFGRIA